MSSQDTPAESRSELPQSLAAAISSQKRDFWGVCAVRRPQHLARLYYLINDTVTIGSAPFADVPVPVLFPIHAVIRRNSSDGSLGIANSSPPSSPPIIAESNGFRMAVEPIQTIGFPLSGNVLLPGGSVFPGQDDVMLEIYAAPKSELVVPSLPSPDLGQVGARVFAHVSDPNIRLRDMLACQVCHELMFDTVTASPCCHHFCAPCLSQWLDSDNANAHSCPVCRVILSAATPDPLVRAICAAYVQVEPSHARAPEEIRQLQKVDTSSIARVGERRRHLDNCNQAGEDEDESEGDDDGGFDEDAASWGLQDGGLDSSGMIRGPDAFALDIHAPFRPPSFGGENGDEPQRRTLQRWSEMFSTEVDALDLLDEIAVNSYLSDVWMTYIASFIACKISDKLQYIHLPDCGLGSAAAPLLGEALCLHFNRVAQRRIAGPSRIEGDEEVGEVRGVKELYVDSNFLRDDGCISLLCAPLRHPACTLRAISISSVGLRDSGFATLAAALATNSTVAELNIRHNPLGDGSIELLCDILKGERCALSCLEIGSNTFGSRGLAALGKSLEYSTSLKTLAISSVSSDGEGTDCSCWEAWSLGLRVNRTLQHIILHSCNLSAQSCSILCVGLDHNSTLTRLVLDYNSVGDEGCISLSRVMYAAAMRRVPDRNDATSSVPQIWGLQEVSVVANCIGETGGAVLLRTLVAGGCKLIVDGIGWAIASEVEPLQPEDPNFMELRAADSLLAMALEHIAASVGQQRAAIGEALPPLPDVLPAQNSGAAAFACAISSHIPSAHAPFVSLLACVVPRSSVALDLGALCQELLYKAPVSSTESDSFPARVNVLQRYVDIYEKLLKQFLLMIARGDAHAAGEIIQMKGNNSLDECVRCISNTLLQLSVPSSHKIFYGLPLSVTRGHPSPNDHWCVVNSGVDGTAPRIWVAWRQDAAYFFVNGSEEMPDCDCDGFSTSLLALKDVIGTLSDSGGGECATAGSGHPAPFIDVIATHRVEWPGPGHDSGNRMREESTNDVILVALSLNEASSSIMVNPNPLQWGRVAACATFDLGSVKQPEPNSWTCNRGHALWPVLLMPDERYAGGWACDVCDSHLPFFCQTPVLHCENCKFDVCSNCQAKFTPEGALDNVAAQNELGWRDVDDDEVSFNENDDDDDGINADFDGDDSDLNPLSSSENEGSDEQDAFGDLGGPVQESNSSDDDGGSVEGSQGTYGRVPHVFVDASFNDLGADVRRALHAAPMFSRCVRVFHVSSVSQFSRAPSAHSASHGMAGGDDSPRAEQ